MSSTTANQPTPPDVEKTAGIEHHEHAPSGSGIPVQLTREQYERMFLEPGGRGPAAGSWNLAQRFGNPTLIAMASFNLVLAPTSTYLLRFGSADASSLAAIVGPFYALGGAALFISGVMEWILGNTFPSVVFITFGGFWITSGFLNDAQFNVVGVFQSTGGAASPALNDGLMFYYIFWTVLVFIYWIASLKTNLCFAFILGTIDFTLALLSAGYSAVGDGNLDRATKLFKASGGFAFGASICTFYLILVLTFDSVGFPVKLPVGDLSGFLSKKKTS